MRGIFHDSVPRSVQVSDVFVAKAVHRRPWWPISIQNELRHKISGTTVRNLHTTYSIRRPSRTMTLPCHATEVHRPHPAFGSPRRQVILQPSQPVTAFPYAALSGRRNPGRPFRFSGERAGSHTDSAAMAANDLRTIQGPSPFPSALSLLKDSKSGSHRARVFPARCLQW